MDDISTTSEFNIEPDYHAISIGRAIYHNHHSMQREKKKLRKKAGSQVRNSMT